MDMAQLSQESQVIRQTDHPASPGPLPARTVFWGLAGLAVVMLLWWGYARTSRPVTLQVGQRVFAISTHHPTVATLLRELDIALQPEDIVQPPPATQLAAGDTLTIQLARPVTIQADGEQRQLLTHRPRVDLLLADIGLSLNPRDGLFINGLPAAHDAALPEATSLDVTDPYQRLLANTTPRGAVAAQRPQPVSVTVQRAIRVALHDEQVRTTFFTASPTVAEALAEQNVSVLPGDRVSPPPESPLSPGMSIFIKRATPVVIQADGEIFEARTQRETVAQLLAEQGIALMGQDYSRPPLDAPIAANDKIEIVRVRELVEFEEEYIDFETEWVADPAMELDQRQIRAEGATGIIRSRTRVRYEDGAEIRREFEDEWLAQEPKNQVIAYGTDVVVRTLNTPNGPIEYWRKISMRATAYSAATSGKDADHPRYGITSSGLPAGKGVVAVDPKVIPLRTQLYVADYGPAIAGDTGGRILGKHIDLGFPDDEPLPVIFEWRDVYILTPVPPADRIRYVLPNWPQR
ncbi:MAG: hypothetical protein Kow0031_38830 [Anaerolineae bacterium]